MVNGFRLTRVLVNSGLLFTSDLLVNTDLELTGDINESGSPWDLYIVALNRMWSVGWV